VLVPPMQLEDLGSMMVVIDPAGAAIGFWQPGTRRVHRMG
jgi:predicted enzyme related to lactoylglutathione lyase